MNTGLAKLEEKYGVPDLVLPDPVVPATDTREPAKVLMHWKDSEPVVMLSALLKEYSDQGFFLQQTSEGQPTLYFNPGLKTKEHNPDRWDLAQHAMYLLDQAREDLKDLILHGLITLPQNVWL